MKYIAIDGPGGSGKTHLANTLAQRFGAEVLHLDDFGNDYEPFVGIPALVEAIEKAREGILIFEGVGVFDSRFDQFKPFRIFVNTAPALRKEWAAGRDVPSSDRSAEEWAKIYEIWKQAEVAYFTPEIMAKADVTTAEGGVIDIDAIAARIELVE